MAVGDITKGPELVDGEWNIDIVNKAPRLRLGDIDMTDPADRLVVRANNNGELSLQFYDASTDTYTELAAFLSVGSMRLPKISDPSAPSANHGLLYVRDNGAGKNQLVARFPTGAIQVIATQP